MSYNEGAYAGLGNAQFYGSFLMRAGFIAGGTVDFYFDERIARGEFPPAEWGLPRVYVSQTDTGK